MEPILKRIGDVTIERLTRQDDPKNMNSESDSSSESLSSDDELNPERALEEADELEKLGKNQKRKNDFSDESKIKKTKSDVISESVKESERTELDSEEEDSEYDSEEESDIDMPINDLAEGKVDSVSVIDPEKTDFIEKLAGELGESSQKSEDDKIDTSEYDYDITEKLKEMGKLWFIY